MTDTYGPSSLGSFAHYDPDTQSLRMSTGTSLWGSTKPCTTLPRSGSMLSGRLYERRTSVPPIAENGSSALLHTPRGSSTENQRVLGIPTPSVADATRDGKSKRKLWEEYGGTKGLSLHHWADLIAEGRMEEMFVSPEEKRKQRLLPTPRTTDSNGAGEHGSGGPDLRTQVQRLLPTPSASNPNDTESVESWETRAAELKAKHGNGNGAGTPLSIEVRRLLGGNSAQRSQDGNPSSEGEPPAP